VRIETGRPKRKSGVYPKRLFWGFNPSSHWREDGDVVTIKSFHRFQLDEGPGIFGGRNFKLIPC
jgi:hypothetical protein